MIGKYACADALALLSLSLDQELRPLERRKLDRHLLVCSNCGRKGASVEAITLALRNLPPEMPSISLLPRLPRRRRVARNSLPATAAVIVASLGLVTLQGSVSAGSVDISPALTVSSTPKLSPITYAIPPQQQPYAYAAAVQSP
jgi:anti-sigma factor RsiW